MDVKEIIEKIKASLPFLNKGEEDDDDEVTGEHEVDIDDDEEEDAPKKKKAKGDGAEDDEDDEEEGEVDEAAQKRSKIIKGVAGLVVAWVAIDEFVLKEEPPPPAPVVRKRPQRKKPAKTVATPAAEAPSETPMAESTPEITETPEVVQTPEPQMTPEMMETPVAEFTPEATPEETPEPVATVELDLTPETPTAGGETDTGANPMGGFVDGDTGAQPVDNALNNLVDNVKDQNLEDKIAPPKMEYVEPPDYESLGRGLVYNCKGKHWACVDKRSYFKCRDNQKWSKENTKAPECVTRPVYASYEDCRTIQKYYVNTSFKVDFCE